jgi:zinc transport system substrate-binding protein
MMISRLRLVAALMLVCTALMGCAREDDARISIVVSTTIIETVVESVAGQRATVSSIVPGGMCPGHFDIKPRQMQQIERADMFLYHGWESWLPKVIDATEGATETVEITVEGSWMIPDVHIQAIYWIRDLLISVDPAGDDYYEERAVRYENEILRTANSICQDLRDFQGTPVLCSELQEEFLSWAGFDILGTYGRAENLSPRTLEQLIRTGKDHAVKLVVDNLQSGTDAGKRIADEIQSGHAILTNFPIKGSYTQTLRSNTEALKEGLM